ASPGCRPGSPRVARRRAGAAWWWNTAARAARRYSDSSRRRLLALELIAVRVPHARAIAIEADAADSNAQEHALVRRRCIDRVGLDLEVPESLFELQLDARN